MLLSKPIKTDDNNDQTFKLMALPDHARKIVILNMGAVQMFLISMCSSKMKKISKKYTRLIQFDLEIDIDESIVFIIKTDNVQLGSFCVKSSRQKFSSTDTKLFAHGNFDELITFWKDMFCGASRMYENLLNQFSSQMRTCGFPSKENLFAIRRLIVWTNALMPKLTDITITIPESVSEKQCFHVIKRLEQLQFFNIYLDSERNYNTVDIIMNGKRWFVHCAEWITLIDLFKFDSVLLYLIGVRLTDDKLNAFLRAYIRNETSQNLEHMCMTVNHQMDINTLFDGLVWSRVEEKDARKIENSGILAEATTEDFFRIVMRNNEICYVRIWNPDDETRLLYIRNFKDEVYKPFKLLKLPYLAVEQVIKNMSLMEAFNFAHCSSTLRHFVKYFFKKQKVKLLVQIYEDISFRLESPNGTCVVFDVRDYSEILGYLDKVKRMKIGNASKIPFLFKKHEPNHLITYWRDIVKGATEFYSLILELFDIHFDKLHVWKEKINVDYGSVVGWINRVNRPIEEVYFAKGTVDDPLISQTFFSENFQKCITVQKPSENFKSPDFRFTAAHVNWQVLNAHWITPENLSDIGSTCLVLKGLEFTDQDMNSIFKALITGKFQNLELIGLELNRSVTSRSVILDGIADLENNEINRDVRIFDRHGYNITVQGAHDVQMATGETCSFMFYTIGVYVYIWK